MGEAPKHYRLASKAMGDDTTLTRYVRNNGDHTRQKQRQPRFDPAMGTGGRVV